MRCLDPLYHLLKRLIHGKVQGQILQTQKGKRLKVGDVGQARATRILYQPKRRQIDAVRQDQFHAVVLFMGIRSEGLETALLHLSLQDHLILEVLRLPHPALLCQNLRKNYHRLKVDHQFLCQDTEGEYLEPEEVDIPHIDQAAEQGQRGNELGIQHLLARGLVVVVTDPYQIVTQEVGKVSLRHRMVAERTDSIGNETLMQDMYKGAVILGCLGKICRLIVVGSQEVTPKIGP